MKNGAKGHAKNMLIVSLPWIWWTHCILWKAPQWFQPQVHPGTQRYGEYGNGQAVQNGMKMPHAELGGPLVAWRGSCGTLLSQCSLQNASCWSPTPSTKHAASDLPLWQPCLPAMTLFLQKLHPLYITLSSPPFLHVQGAHGNVLSKQWLLVQRKQWGCLSDLQMCKS